MFPARSSLDGWREALKIISRCPICSAAYETERARLLAKSETAGLIHITCQQCASSFVAMVLVLGQGLSSVGMVTDLNYEDIERLHKAASFTVDEIIEGYQQMQNNEFVKQALKMPAES